MRYWSAENPHIVQQVPLHSDKVGVWCDSDDSKIMDITTNVGYDVPKVVISNNSGVKLCESINKKPCGHQNLKHIIVSLKIIQEDSNAFLTKLVQEQTPAGKTGESNEDIADDDNEEQDDDDNDDNVSPKKKKRRR
ncbi:hypothetical protein ANN_23705 [Periplaneta americana]|uniref:Uncharacterized protein n=1 Tax=Periplaneta americana TaxID=6978 RepID=A0ABQ8SLU9_PERAM|nr:hypothetical protein ANN_23705 [Periplaneta americana]